MRFVVLAVLVVLAVPAHAQSITTGAIEGRVTDRATKDPLPGVTVIATGIGEPQTAITDGDGAYKISDLLPGSYDVTFYVDKISITRRAIRVGANDQITLHQIINLTGDGDVIEVYAPPPQINQSSTAKGTSKTSAPQTSVPASE